MTDEVGGWSRAKQTEQGRLVLSAPFLGDSQRASSFLGVSASLAAKQGFPFLLPAFSTISSRCKVLHVAELWGQTRLQISGSWEALSRCCCH